VSHTCKIVIPAAVNESSSSFLEESKVAGRTRTKVGWPNWALAFAMYFPMYPVAPSTKTRLFPILAIILSSLIQGLISNEKDLKITI
jgi:hypothetical protein